MNLLAKHFDTAFDAPDGIAKLRELILTLAMQGKLVPQDPKDQPASELLKQIAVEKKRLVKEGKIKDKGSRGDVISNPKKVTRGDAENAEINGPYEVPKGWVWTRLGDVGETKTGTTPATKDSDNYGTYIPFIGPGDIQKFQIDYSVNGLSKKGAESARLIDANSVLMVCIGGSIGKHAVNIHEVACNQQINAITPLKVDVKFLFYALGSKLIQDSIIEHAGGSATPIINKQKWSCILTPLPPLPEQKRIVAKIDQLMSLCDALETQKKACHQKNLDVHAAAIHQLLSPSSATPRLRENSSPSSSANSASPREELSLSDAWAFLQNHFGDLYTVKENVAELRKAILQLAVMGKLVKQDPKDQPASELLKEIQREKARLVKEGKIRAPRENTGSRGDAENAEIQGPYEVPKGWVWTRLDEIVDVGTGSTPSTTNHEYYNGSIPWYTSSATNNPMAAEPEKYITDKALKETNCKVFPSGSLIIALYGQGKTRGQISELVIPGATNQAIAAMVFRKATIDVKSYLKHFFKKIYSEIRLLAEGAAQPNLNVGKIKETLIPLPPLPEQKRIVAKIDQLMSLCDGLEQQIDASSEKQSKLLASLLAGI